MPARFVACLYTGPFLSVCHRPIPLPREVSPRELSPRCPAPRAALRRDQRRGLPRRRPGAPGGALPQGLGTPLGGGFGSPKGPRDGPRDQAARRFHAPCDGLRSFSLTAPLAIRRPLVPTAFHPPSGGFSPSATYTPPTAHQAWTVADGRGLAVLNRASGQLALPGVVSVCRISAF